MTIIKDLLFSFIDFLSKAKIKTLKMSPNMLKQVLIWPLTLLWHHHLRSDPAQTLLEPGLHARLWAAYLVVVTGSRFVRHVKNPQRAGSLHAAPRAVTCRGEGGEVRGERSEVRGEGWGRRVRCEEFSSVEMVCVCVCWLMTQMTS